MSAALGPGDLDAATRDALRRHVLTLADSKRILGLRYSDWLLGAPSIETGIAASSMAQDEWGHARLLYAMLKDFGEDPAEAEHDRDPERYASIPALDEPLGDWADVVAAMVVVDGALTVALEGFAGGAWEAARGRVPKMLSEEEFHRDMGLAWMRRLATGSGEARARMTSALEAVLPSTLAWLAPDDAPFRALVSAGITQPAQALLDRFDEVYADALQAAGVEGWKVDRSGWDEARGRGAGAPEAEVVERARGDLNRALLVE